jgi:prepilin-type N-terminal cleavage/methylation domain-containing protein
MRRRLVAARNDGFTLVEMMIAIAIIAIMFTGAAIVLASTLSSAAQTRLKQHAVEAATEILEDARAIDYATVATQNVGADITQLVGEGYISVKSAGPPATYSFDPDGPTGPLVAEDVVLASSSAIDPIQVLQRNGAQYTVRTIVTDPDSTATPYKRVTTQVSWTQNGQTFKRHITSLISETRRGLPLPNFAVGDNATFTYALGGKVHLPFSITNNGARDSWNISATATPSRSWTDPAQPVHIQWYRDNSPGDGLYSPGETLLTDTSGDGPVDTGLMETDEARKIVGYLDLASVPLEPAGTVVVTITLTSESQPTSNPKTVTITLNLTGAPGCTGGCTLTPYYFHNQYPGTGATTLRTSDMPANTTLPTQTTLPNYDTDQDSVAGRRILQGTGDWSESTSTKIANWSYQVPAATLVKGSNTVTLKVWVTTRNGLPATVVLNGYARYTTTGSASSTVPLGTGSGSVSLSFPTGTEWLLAQIPITVASDTTINNNRYLKAYVTVSDALSTDDAVIGYDTVPTVFGASATATPGIEIPKG